MSPTATQRCLWAGCSTTCATAKSLFDHAYTVHCVRTNVKAGLARRGLLCKWADCTKTPQFGGRKSHAAVHLAAHAGYLPFECARCSERFSASSTLRNHTLRAHGGMGQRAADKATCNSEEELDWVDSPRAQPARSKSPALSELSELSDDSSAPPPLSSRLSPRRTSAIRCEWSACGLTLATATELLTHLRNAHTLDPGYGTSTCLWNLCDRSCVGRRGLSQHVRVHVPEEHTALARVEPELGRHLQEPHGGDSVLQHARSAKRPAVDIPPDNAPATKRRKEAAVLVNPLNELKVAPPTDALEAARLPELHSTDKSVFSSTSMDALAGRPPALLKEQVPTSSEPASVATLVVRMTEIIDEFNRREELDQKQKNDGLTSGNSDSDTRAFENSDWSTRFYEQYTDLYEDT